ncbi:MAG: hypothetical protein ABEK50_16265 [bacterium]
MVLLGVLMVGALAYVTGETEAILTLVEFDPAISILETIYPTLRSFHNQQSLLNKGVYWFGLFLHHLFLVGIVMVMMLDDPFAEASFMETALTGTASRTSIYLLSSGVPMFSILVFQVPFILASGWLTLNTVHRVPPWISAHLAITGKIMFLIILIRTLQQVISVSAGIVFGSALYATAHLHGLYEISRETSSIVWYLRRLLYVLIPPFDRLSLFSYETYLNQTIWGVVDVLIVLTWSLALLLTGLILFDYKNIDPVFEN